MSDSFYGKFRGVVTDIQDPLQQGRVRARVPDVLGDRESGWAMPCLPFAGDGMGFFGLPKVGAGIWIEFEHGDPDYPVWAGCWYGGVAEVPPVLLAPPYKKTLIDTPGVGGITLETSGGQKIKISATGIEVDNGQGAKITLQGPQVNVNNGALEVI